MDFDKIKLIHKNKSSEDHNINISTDLKEKIYDYYKIDFEELNYGK